MSASAVAIVAAIIVYIMSGVLRTTAGRCELMLLLGILLIHSSYAWIHHVGGDIVQTLVSIETLWTFFWGCVLAFDVWRSFRFVRQQKFIQNYFYKYFSKVSKRDRRRIKEVSPVLLFPVRRNCHLRSFAANDGTLMGDPFKLFEVCRARSSYLFRDDAVCERHFATAYRLHGLSIV